MKSLKNDTELLVEEFQQSNNSEALLLQYQPFINKYMMLFTSSTIPFKYYDIRYFLSFYLKDKEDMRSLRRGKYHSKEDISNANRITTYLKQAFEGYEDEEIYHELIIPFLECAKRYKFEGRTFNAYLYRTYKYALMRHINSLLFNRFTIQDVSMQTPEQSILDQLSEKEEEPQLKIELDDLLSLNHPLWLAGVDTKEPFKQFTREERLILVKYYMEKNTDKEIGRLVGRNRRSINRSRLRAIRKLENEVKEETLNGSDGSLSS